MKAFIYYIILILDVIKNTLSGPSYAACPLMLWYVERKKAAHRFDGQGQYDQSKAATWNMIKGVEQVP